MTPTYQVVTHTSGRQSCWPMSKPLPNGWHGSGIVGSEEECLASITSSQEDAPPAEQNHDHGSESDSNPGKAIQLSLMFFGDQESDPTGDRYRLFFDACRFADQAGFAGIWVPERHFTQFGCLYPNPAVLQAALARETKRIRLRAGSVVLPLHQMTLIAEQWSMVDNLSGGRAEVAVASGWHPNDFVLAPDHYEQRSDRMYECIEQLERLWKGDTIDAVNGTGETIPVRIYPTPIQSRLPIWLTVAGNPKTFERAGELGYHVLTHLFDQNSDQLAENIALYRSSRAKHGHDPTTGQVSVALHTFIGESLDDVREHAESPYCDYLRNNLGLLKQLAFSRGQSIDPKTLSETDMNDLLRWMFSKFLGGRSLLGTVETCAATAEELSGIGVNEIACLLDFGPTHDAILNSLPLLKSLQHTIRSTHCGHSLRE